MNEHHYQHLPQISVTLGQFFEVCGVGSIVHIGTTRGTGWCFTGTCEEAQNKLAGWANRKIDWLYFHEGRTAQPGYCCELKPGFGIRVEGYESGI